MSIEVSVNDLAGAARAITRAGSPADVFRAFLEVSRTVAPRAAVFLVRRGEVNGWGSVGFPTDVAHRQRAYRAAADQGWLGQVARELSGASVERPADAVDPDFGQAPSADAMGCALCIEGQPIALLVSERAGDEEPWLPEGLALLAGVAGLRLALSLARRQAAAAETSATEKTASPEPQPTESPSAAEPRAEQAPGLDIARRYARLVATDIRLYNEEAVIQGRQNGDLVDRIGEHIGRGKDTFLRRHKDLGSAGLEVLHEAYVQVLAGGDDTLIPTSVLE